MNKLLVLLSLGALVFLPGCFGCGSTKEMMVEQPIESEDERVERLTIAIIRKLDSEKTPQQTPTTLPAPLPAAPVGAPVAKMPAVPGRRSFVIEDVSAPANLITFMSDSATVVSMNPKRFGQVRKLSIIDGPDRWQLRVYSVYDFAQVVNYLRSFE